MIGSRPRNKIEGSSVTNMTRWLEGNRKEDNRTGKKKKKKKASQCNEPRSDMMTFKGTSL